jgi:anthranilate phosphoribosyltransferase
MDGMDEVTLTGPTRIGEICDGAVSLSTIEPEDFGLRRCTLADLQGGDASTNAAIVRDLLEGHPGPKREVVLLNAAYALVAAGLAKDVEAGLVRARGVIDDGLAMAKLKGLVTLTNA